MKIFGIIAEFNPLHNGHRYLIEKTKAEGADLVVAVLSGALVQRGEFSYISKWARARSAIGCGVDLVLELPCVYSCASAPFFGGGAIEILHKMGCIDAISFGSESGDISLLNDVAAALANTSENEQIKALLKKGASYAKAAGSIHNLPPNDILATNYIAAINKQKSDILPIPIKRVAVSHDSLEVLDNFTSASNIRSSIENEQDFSAFLPKTASEIIDSELSAGRTIDKKALFIAITTTILTKSPEELREILDITEGLEYRIIDACKTAVDYDDLIFKIKSKRYTLSRIRRILLYILIGIKKGVYQSEQSGARILAIGRGGDKILNAADKSFKLTASAAELLKTDENYRYENIACDLFSMLCKNPYERAQNYTQQIIKLTNN